MKLLNKNKSKQNDKNLNLQDIKNITLIDDNTSKEIINFKKIDINKLSNFKYREAKIDGSLVSSMAAPVALDSIIKVANPNGFFTATVNPSTLIQYSQGGFSSMVKGASGIVKHSGFVSSTVSVFAPMVIFQALSIVTGQYYLNGINKQLSNISSKIDDLQFFVESKDVAKINVIQDEIFDLFNKNNLTQQDFNTISKFKIELKFIKERYRELIEKIICEIESINKNNIKTLNEKKNKVKKYSNVFYGSQQLLFYVEQIELFSYIKNKNFQYISDIYNRIKNYTIEKISFDDTLKKIEKLQEEIGNPIFGSKDKEIHKLNFKFGYLDKKLKKEYTSFETDINNAKINLNNKWNESQEILYYIDENNKQRMFIKDTDNKFNDAGIQLETEIIEEK